MVQQGAACGCVNQLDTLSAAALAAAAATIAKTEQQTVASSGDITGCPSSGLSYVSHLTACLCCLCHVLLPGLQDADGDTALHNAARGGHLRVVQYLLQLGADPSVKNGDGKTPAAEADEADVIRALVQAAQQKQTAAAGAACAAAVAALTAAADPAEGTEPAKPEQKKAAE